MIFVSRKTIAALTDDAQMSALLAGCVAEVMDEEAYRLSPSVRNTGIAEVASAAVPYAGLPGIVAGSVYENHLVHVAQQQSARIAVTYLLLAGLPMTAAPAAWETLDGKDGVLNPHTQPGDRADTAYAAVANAPPPGMISALVSK